MAASTRSPLKSSSPGSIRTSPARVVSTRLSRVESARLLGSPKACQGRIADMETSRGSSRTQSARHLSASRGATITTTTTSTSTYRALDVRGVVAPVEVPVARAIEAAMHMPGCEGQLRSLERRLAAQEAHEFAREERLSALEQRCEEKLPETTVAITARLETLERGLLANAVAADDQWQQLRERLCGLEKELDITGLLSRVADELGSIHEVLRKSDARFSSLEARAEKTSGSMKSLQTVIASLASLEDDLPVPELQRDIATAIPASMLLARERPRRVSHHPALLDKKLAIIPEEDDAKEKGGVQSRGADLYAPTLDKQDSGLVAENTDNVVSLQVS